MNKPAPKEPSMDEILSSIRQIIADDDAAGVSRRPAIQAAPAPMQATPVARPAEATADADQKLSDMLDEIEPLALTPSQILEDQDEVGDDEVSFDAILADTAEEQAPLVDPEDITFDPAELEAASFADEQEAEEEEASASFASEVEVEPEPAPQPARTAPMPDPTLSSDMAEQLLEPATNAAVRSTFARLNNLGLGTQGLTIEAMIRDMLRPMLKEWLDENLPSVVERMVEKEIARISRGE